MTAYADDQTMAELKQAGQEGWYWSHRSRDPSSLQLLWVVRDELHESEGFLYVGERLVVPVGARSRMLDLIHQGYLGIQKCKDRA